MARSYLITDPELVDQLAELARKIAADLMASAAAGNPRAEAAANAWTALALVFCDDLPEPVG